MNYRRLRKKFDLREVLPDTKFVTKRNKTGLVTFVDNFSEKKCTRTTGFLATKMSFFWP